MIRYAALRVWTATALFVTLAAGARAATPASLVHDIRHSSGPNLSSSPRTMVSLGKRVLFWARTPRLGMELYKTDGTSAGTSLLLDLCPGPCDSVGYFEPIVIGSRAFFLASDGARGVELWQSNGTAPGTRSYVDLAPGPADGAYLFLLDGGDRVLFGTFGPSLHGWDLWSSNGSIAGSKPFVRLSGEAGGGASIPEGAGSPRPMPGGRKLYLRNSRVDGIDELWQTDGTAAGTRRVLALDQSVAAICSNVPDLPRVESGVAIVSIDSDDTGCEPWRVANGAASRILDLAPGVGGAQPHDFVQFGGSTLFAARGPQVGEEIWRTDGTAAGTVLLGDAYPGPEGSAPMFLGILGNQAYFSAMNVTEGRELWATNGTPGSLHRVADLVPGPESSDPNPAGSAGGHLFFWTNADGPEAALFAVDAGGTVAKLASVEAPSYLSSGFAAVGKLGLFGADLKDGRGAELGTTNGTPEGTRAFLDLAGGDPSADPRQLTRFAGRVLFTAIDDAHGREVWKTDGTAAGTRLVADLKPGNGPGFPNFLAPTASGVVLEAPDGSIRHARATGTGIDFLFRPASEVRASRRGFELAGQAYFFTPVGSAANPRFELWRSDGRPGGTLRLAEIAGFDRFFGYAVDSAVDPERGRAFFIPSVIDVQFGPVPAGLWVTDGTRIGTRRILDNPCVGCSGKIGEAILGPSGQFVYTVEDRGDGVSRLWASDGTRAGTVQLAESPNLVDGDPIRSLARLGEKLLFAASDPEHGQELWVSDGTPAGTRLLADLVPGPAPSWPDGITVAGDRAFFSADDEQTGRELWATDGTEEGTYRVKDLRPGTRSSVPQSLTAIGNRLVFAAADDRFGLEVWVSDGTAAGTRLVSDVQVGRLPSSSSDFLVLGSDLLFVASRLATGRELFRLPLSALGTP